MIGNCAYTVDISDNDYKNMVDAFKKSSLVKKQLNEHYGVLTRDPKEVEKARDQNIFNLSCSQGRIDGCIKKVIFNNPTTIVYWKDGTKTVVKCQEGDTFDQEKGLAMAICKKIMGNKSNFNNQFKRIFMKSLIKEEKRSTESMDKERAKNILIDEIAKLEKVMKENGDNEGFKEYKEALEFTVTELSKDNQTVPVWIKREDQKPIQGYLDKSRQILFDKWMTAELAKYVGYEWEEAKEEV
jgi:hypothetical protein